MCEAVRFIEKTADRAPKSVGRPDAFFLRTISLCRVEDDHHMNNHFPDQKTEMRFDIGLPDFLSKMDEERFFQAFRELVAIREFKIMDGGLALWIDMRYLNKSATCELIALMARYSLPLSPVGVFFNRSKGFYWLRDERRYWFKSMFNSTPELENTMPAQTDALQKSKTSIF